MEQRTCRLVWLFQLCLLFLCFSAVSAYKNYTVGDTLGWFDSLQKPNINYRKWAAGKNFSLGDFLIFNTDKNHSVVQTYNFTTYKQCDYDDAETDDTIQWTESEPTVSTDPVVVSVPLLKEGPTYFFSGNYDGEQCNFGQHFNINVTHGQGLPKSLKEQPADSPAPASPDDDDSAPDTVVPSNFTKPEKSDDDDNVKETSRGDSLVGFGKLNGSLVFLGFVWIFG